MTYLGDVFTDSCIYASNRIATVSFDGKELSFGMLYAKTTELAMLLGKYNMNESAHIGLFLPNGPNFVVGYFAIQLCNAVGVLIPSVYKKWDIINVISSCDIDCVITDSARLTLFSKLMSYDSENIIHLFDNMVLIIIKRKIKSKNAEYAGEKPAIIIPTSGSLGKSKAVMLSHENLLSNVNAFIENIKLSENDSTLVVLPLSSSFAHSSQMLAHVFSGSKLIFGDKLFLSKTFWTIVKQKKPTITCMVPSILFDILNVSKKKTEKQPYLKTIILAGAPIPAELTDLCNEKIPEIGIVKAYGLTEASPRVTQLHSQDIKAYGYSVGKPLRNVQIKIIDDENNACASGTPGEILLNGPNIMLGYYNNKALTDTVLNNGWLKTGDIGMLDKQGYLSILGRKKNIIIINGLNIYPEEIECFLSSFSGIREAKVYSQSTNDANEKTIAEIVTSKKISITELIKYCRVMLASYKIPDEIKIVKKIEKTYTGKVKRSQYCKG